MSAKAPWEPTARSVPIFPLKGTALFPGVPHVFEVARERSIQALQTAHQKKLPILAITQRKDDVYDPTAADLWPMGTIAEVQALSRLPSAAIKVTILGSARAWLKKFTPGEAYASGEFETVSEGPPPPDAVALSRTALQLFETWAKTQKTIETPFGTIMVPVAAVSALRAVGKPGATADALAAWLPMPGAAKQKLLELVNPAHRLELLIEKLKAAVAPPRTSS